MLEINKLRLFFNIKRVKAQLERDAVQNNQTVTPAQILEQVSTELGVPMRDVMMMNGRMSGGDMSLNAIQSNDDEGREWIETLADEGPTGAEVVEQSFDEKKLKIANTVWIEKIKTKELASTKLAKSAKSYEIEVMKNNKLKQSSFAHQYIYVLSKNGSIKIENKDIRVKCNDTIYIKPLTEHYFSSKGLKILILSVDSKINQDAKLQLNQIGKKNLDRIIYDDTAWFKR